MCNPDASKDYRTMCHPYASKYIIIAQCATQIIQKILKSYNVQLRLLKRYYIHAMCTPDP